MKKSLMKRFFVEEEGMETLQIVMICAIACVIMTGVALAWPGLRTQMVDAIKTLFGNSPT